MMPLPNLLAAVFLGTGNSYSKIIPRAFFYDSLLDVTEVQSKSIRVLSRYFGMKLLRLEIQLKLENLDVRLLSVENEALLICNFT